ncbi:hypothetical protein [Agaribacter flavus]|uniref:Uncharacterized protein n=1 Tax=Agaribacter flavus TaxID=1902781 RepID=A0ABV7FKX2_9ALTE
MQINSVPYTAHTGAVQSSQQLTTPDTTTSKAKATATDTVTISDAGKNAEAKWQEISNKYDMRNISLNEVGQLSRELFNNGLVSQREMFDMSILPGINFDANQKMDYVDFAKRHLVSLKLHDDGSANMKGAIDAYTKAFDIVKKIG